MRTTRSYHHTHTPGYVGRPLKVAPWVFLLVASTTPHPTPELLLERCREFIRDSRQPRTRTREADEEDGEVNGYFHFNQTRGRGGHCRARQGQRTCRLNFRDLDLLVTNTHPLSKGGQKNSRNRCRDLAQRPNQPRLMAAEATDEDDEEAHASYHHTHPPGYGG